MFLIITFDFAFYEHFSEYFDYYMDMATNLVDDTLPKPVISFCKIVISNMRNQWELSVRKPKQREMINEI